LEFFDCVILQTPSMTVAMLFLRRQRGRVPAVPYWTGMWAEKRTGWVGCWPSEEYQMNVGGCLNWMVWLDGGHWHPCHLLCCCFGYAPQHVCWSLLWLFWDAASTS